MKEFSTSAIPFMHRPIALLFGILVAIATRQGFAQPDQSMPLTTWQTQARSLSPTSTSATMSFEVDSSGELSFVVNATWDQLLVWITAPNGQVVTPASAPLFGGSCAVQHLEFPTQVIALPISGSGSKWWFVLPDLGVGTYTLTVALPQGIPIPPAHNGVEAVSATLLCQSRVGALLLCSPESAFAGQPVVITMGIFNGSTAIQGATVTARVVLENPLAQPITLQMADDGQLADAVAGDGLYSCLFRTTISGLYAIATEASGQTTIGGAARSFRRTSGTVLSVSPRHARFSNCLITPDTEIVVSGGRASSAKFTAGVNVLQAGNFAIVVRLKASNGDDLFAMGEATLGVGITQIVARIDAEGMRSVAVPGPYTIIGAELFHDSDAGRLICDSCGALSITTPAWQPGTTWVAPDIEFANPPVTLQQFYPFQPTAVIWVNCRVAGPYQGSIRFEDECGTTVGVRTFEKDLVASDTPQWIVSTPLGSNTTSQWGGWTSVGGVVTAKDVTIWGPAGGLESAVLDSTPLVQAVLPTGCRQRWVH
jgi:hypothetical protein